MEQQVEPLHAGDLADLEAKRSWVRNHYDEPARHEYETLAGKLRLLAIILDNAWVAPGETLKLQCLGVTFGDALAQELDLTWVAGKDEHGRDPALTLPGTSIRVFPLTTISKRIERGETVDVDALFQNACRTIMRIRDEGV